MSAEVISTQEASVYLQNRGISDVSIIAEIVRSSQNLRTNIALCADTYHFIARNRKPSALDFRAEFEPIMERYIRHLEIVEKEILRILANMPVWDKEMAAQVLKQFSLKFSDETFSYLLGLSCVQKVSNNDYTILAEVKKILLKDALSFPKIQLYDFLFDIYDKKLGELSFENLTPFDTQLFQFAFEMGAETADLATFCLWFEHKSAPFEQAKEYAILLFLNEKLSALLSPNKQEVMPYYNQSLYKRIYYNTQLQQHGEARKILQSLSAAQMAEYRQLYTFAEKHLQQVPEMEQNTPNDIKKWTERLEAGVSSDIERGDLHYRIAQLHLAQADYESAFYHIKESYKARRNILGDFHTDTVDCLVLMGDYYQKMNNSVEAIKHYQRALDISIRNDRHDEGVANLLFNIAEMSIKRKDFQKAVDYFKRCLREWEILGVELNEMMANCHFKMGYVYDEVRNWDPALQQYVTALEMRKLLLGENHDKVADVLHNIGTIYYNRAVYAEAVRYLGKAITVRLSVTNEVSRSLALSYYNITLTFVKMNRKQEAINSLTKAIAIFDRVGDHDMKNKSKNMLNGLQ